MVLLTDAVTIPLAILPAVTASIASTASWLNAENGISNNPAPLPLNNEPEDKKTLPLNVEPLATEVTTNPRIPSADAVTEPLNIFVASTAVNASCASCVNAVNGISNKLAPLPEYVEPELIEIPPLTYKLPVK